MWCAAGKVYFRWLLLHNECNFFLLGFLLGSFTRAPLFFQMYLSPLHLVIRTAYLLRHCLSLSLVLIAWALPHLVRMTRDMTFSNNSGGMGEITILGDTFMRNFGIVFDQETSAVGFASPSVCK